MRLGDRSLRLFRAQPAVETTNNAPTISPTSLALDTSGPTDCRLSFPPSLNVNEPARRLMKTHSRIDWEEGKRNRQSGFAGTKCSACTSGLADFRHGIARRDSRELFSRRYTTRSQHIEV